MIDYINSEGLATAAAEIKSRVGSSSASAGGLQIEKYVDEQVSGGVSVSTLPYKFYRGSAVVLNNEIHILGGSSSSGGSSSYSAKHYKYNGTSWESVSTLPYNFATGSAVVLNNEIHILGGGGSSGGGGGGGGGGSSSYSAKHYKYNGTSWESVSTLPYNFANGSAVVLNNEIHILGGSGGGSAGFTNHYKYNGTSWESVSTLPYNFSTGSAVVLNNEIHILGSIYYASGYLYAKKYYKFDGSSWIDVRALPYEFHSGSAVVLNDAVHILGGGGNSYNTNHYLVGLDCRHIATMLPKGVHILLSDNEDIIYASNAKKISSNIAEVTDTGYVELFAALTDADNIKGYLTFYWLAEIYHYIKGEED